MPLFCCVVEGNSADVSPIPTVSINIYPNIGIVVLIQMLDLFPINIDRHMKTRLLHALYCVNWTMETTPVVSPLRNTIGHVNKCSEIV